MLSAKKKRSKQRGKEVERDMKEHGRRKEGRKVNEVRKREERNERRHIMKKVMEVRC